METDKETSPAEDGTMKEKRHYAAIGVAMALAAVAAVLCVASVVKYFQISSAHSKRFAEYIERSEIIARFETSEGWDIYMDNYGTKEENVRSIAVDGRFISIALRDGDKGTTCFRRYNGNETEDTVQQFRRGDDITRFIDDGGVHGPHDGLVDKIWFPHNDLTLKRERDYSAHKADFDSADRLLAETKERVGAR